MLMPQPTLVLEGPEERTHVEWKRLPTRIPYELNPARRRGSSKSFNLLNVRIIDRETSGLVFAQHALNRALTTNATRGTSLANRCDQMSATRQVRSKD